MYVKILLGTDGSPDSRRATAVAASLTKAFDTQLTIATVAVEHGAATVPWSSESDDRPVPDEVAAKWAQVEQAWLSEQGIDADVVVLHGRAAEALAEEATKGGYDLLVIGHRGRSGGGGVPRTGSVAAELVDLAERPLLIVP